MSQLFKQGVSFKEKVNERRSTDEDRLQKLIISLWIGRAKNVPIASDFGLCHIESFYSVLKTGQR